MQFTIEIMIDRKQYRFRVEQIYADDRIERYKVSGKNRYIVIQSNRNFFHNRGLKHRKPNWIMTEGTLQNSYAFEQICKAVDKYTSFER